MKKNQLKPRVLVIVGPTASGKSEFAVQLAKQVHGEIISADSRQVYRGLDIGSGKVRGRWRVHPETRKKVFFYKNIPHYCIDFISPKRQYTAANFARDGMRAIENILRRGKTLIVCGGTGLYIDTLFGLRAVTDVPPNAKLRAKLEKLPTAKLFMMLKKRDPSFARKIDRHNPRRLIRALEIIDTKGKMPPPAIGGFPYPVRWIGIKRKPNDLKTAIARRIRAWLRNGFIEEVKRLRAHELSWRRLDSFGLEYRLVAKFLRGEINSRKELACIMEKKIWRYHKRQMTWWRKNKAIVWRS